jgi:hypothetical protein
MKITEIVYCGLTNLNIKSSGKYYVEFLFKETKTKNVIGLCSSNNETRRWLVFRIFSFLPAKEIWL